MLHESSYLRTAAPTIPRTAPDRIEMTPFEQTGAHAEMAPPEKRTRTAAQREKVLADPELAGVYEHPGPSRSPATWARGLTARGG